MAKDTSYQYYDLAKPILPYRSYTSPTDETPHFVQGSQNIMASQIGYLEKRPGFSSRWGVFDDPNVAKRIFGWRRWNSSFFTMLSTFDGAVAKVWKKQVGTDADFVLIWTSVSATPFDFVTSDNFCFFGNETDMRKYDGTTVSKWGCDAPINAPAVVLTAGVLPPGMSMTGGVFSGTPTTPGTTQITVTATDSTGASTQKTFNFEVLPNNLRLNTFSILPELTKGAFANFPIIAAGGTPGYTYSLFSGTMPTGLTINSGTGAVTGTPTVAGQFDFAIKVTDSASAVAVQSYSIYVQDPATLSLTPGSPLNGFIGTAYSSTLTASGGTGPYTFSFLPTSNPLTLTPYNSLPSGISASVTSPNLTLSGTPIQAGSYAFRILVKDAAGNSFVVPYIFNILTSDLTILNPSFPPAYVNVPYATTISVMGGTAPYTFTAVGGTLDAQTGYIYGYSYTTVYGHESNVSPLSDTTGIFTGLDPAITVIASNDPQVTGINIYRTTDGGVADPAIMRIVVSLININQTYIDSTQDQFLGTQTGPGFLINTPPTPTRGFVWSNGRIYGFTNAMTAFSGLEEVSNGIPEEAWPSGTDGNFYNWPSQVGGMAVTQNGVNIALSEQVWQISGDSLDTFRKAIILDHAGTGSPTCINAVGNSVQWFDSSKQVWSSSMGEIGEPIRTDLQSMQPDSTFIGYHKSGNFNWIYLLDSIAGKLFLYDLDTDQWYPPWTIAASAIWSGETSPGVIDLLVTLNNVVIKLVPGTYFEYQPLNHVTYEDDIKTNLIPVSPGRTTTARSKMEPTQIEEIMFEQSASDYDGIYPAFVGLLCDNDPVQSSFTEWFDLTANNTTPQYIPRRSKICQYRFICDSTTDPAIRNSYWVQFAPSETGWKIYSLTLSWIPT